jgi:fatty acid desaturase
MGRYIVESSIGLAPESQTTEAKTDEYCGKLPSQIPTEKLRRLSVLRPAITVTHIALEWLFILGSIWLCTRFWNPLVYLLAVLWIGGRQHALGVLMHEGAHYRIFRNKRLNDWVSDIFLAWPILITTASYRANHWQHHRFTNTGKDPDCHRKLFEMNREDWEFPTTRIKLSVLFLKDLTAVSAFSILRSLFFLSKRDAQLKKTSSTTVPAWARVSFYVILISLAIAFGFWKQLILLWIVPYLTVFNLLLHIRGIAEHFATDNDHPLNITRTIIAGWLERMFFPKNINYHIEHHLYPSVPFYNLPELHKVLMEQPVFKEKAHITQTYLGVLRECVTAKGHKRTCLPEAQ